MFSTGKTQLQFSKHLKLIKNDFKRITNDLFTFDIGSQKICIENLARKS